MRGILWKVKGLNTPGRNICLGNLIRSNRADFIGIQETKMDSFHPSFLKNLTTPAVFSWHFLPANGTAGGILIGSRDDTMDISNVISHTFSIFCILSEKNKDFS
jgi:exonuclease III